MKKAKGNKGITLVALIITVIIILILAGVTISLVIGENGLINKSKDTAKISFEKNVQESLELAIADLEISKTESGEKVEITDLLEEGYINEEGVINIDKLLGKKGQYGNGTNNQDVFVIENNELWYYEKTGEGKKISELGALDIITPAKYFELTYYGKVINLAESQKYYEGTIKHKNAPLEEYIIPSKLNGKKIETIGYFNGQNIKSIIIKNGIKDIRNYSFESVPLSNITIPKSITCIGYGAFSKCYRLTTVNYEGTEEEWKAINIESNNNELTNAKINYNYKE